ncbi:hypothetical protein AB1Y20_012327 [Prymnesium parvum]|uniref:Uncharacterized protein n=1 Tax=Prymnesium parvum TaxID=97485 RepID=A0AB34IRG8_PRYPA
MLPTDGGLPAPQAPGSAHTQAWSRRSCPPEQMRAAPRDSALARELRLLTLTRCDCTLFSRSLQLDRPARKRLAPATAASECTAWPCASSALVAEGSRSSACTAPRVGRVMAHGSRCEHFRLLSDREDAAGAASSGTA